MRRSLRAAALLAALGAGAVAAPPASAAERTIEVVGQAERTARNDRATLEVGVEVARLTRTEALRAASSRVNRVRAAVRRLGVEAKDVQTTFVSVKRVRVTSRGMRVTRFRVSNVLQVILRDVTKVGRAIDAVTKAGATDVNGPAFGLSDPKAVYRDALDAAYDDARAKAERLAARAGGTLGSVISVSERTSSFPGEDEEFLRAGGGDSATPVSAGSTLVEATVSVVFELR